MSMAQLWTVWFGIGLAWFTVLETYAGLTKQDTLSQTVWKLQDENPYATWLIVTGMIVLIIHFGGHRLLDLSPLIKWFFKTFTIF